MNMRWPWSKPEPKFYPVLDLDPTKIRLRLTEHEADAFKRICEKEFRRPEDQARMIISDYIKDYNG